VKGEGKNGQMGLVGGGDSEGYDGGERDPASQTAAGVGKKNKCERWGEKIIDKSNVKQKENGKCTTCKEQRGVVGREEKKPVKWMQEYKEHRERMKTLWICITGNIQRNGERPIAAK